MRLPEGTIGLFEPPPLVTAATFNCGARCRRLGAVLSEHAVVWMGGMEFCDICACFPHHQISCAQAPDHYLTLEPPAALKIAAE
ncbi:MAG: hypothetical protein V4681_00760 [Patescibacteria group bacterium]